MKRVDTNAAKPFIKWVGGKTQLLKDIKKLLPANLGERKELTYVEPFVGGGAVLFWILQEYPNITKAVINDINAELICTYRVIKYDVNALIAELHRLQNEYIPLDSERRKAYFLKNRNLFNAKTTTDVQTAALFIFFPKFAMKSHFWRIRNFFRVLKFFVVISRRQANMPVLMSCIISIPRIVH